MTSGKSYDARASHRNLDSEVERLRFQAQASWQKEFRKLTAFGLRDGMSVLELGSGPGFITEQLLRSCPAGRVTAVEIDEALAKMALDCLKPQDAVRVRLVKASVMQTGLQANAFDFAVARLLFQHLPDPVGAAKEIRRVLKPGGKLAIIDSDDDVWGLTEPAIPDRALVFQKYGQAQALQGGNRNVGRALWRILENAGFAGIELDAALIHSDEVGIQCLAPQLHPDRLLPLMHAGLISPSYLCKLRSWYEQLATADRPIVMMLLLLGCGEKPTFDSG